MRTSILVLTILITAIMNGQKTDKTTFLKYKLTKDRKLVWARVYETDKNINELLIYFKTQPLTTNLEIVDGKIIGRSGKTKVSNDKGASMLASQEFDFFVKIEVKEGRYKATVTNVKFAPVEVSMGAFSGGLGLGISNDVSGTWEDTSVRNKHHEIRRNSGSTFFLATLNNDLASIFRIKKDSTEIW